MRLEPETPDNWGPVRAIHGGGLAFLSFLGRFVVEQQHPPRCQTCIVLLFPGQAS